MPRDQLDVLKLTDYTMISFSRPDIGVPVELYVAYYASQRSGASIHSPRTCLPGGGWMIEDLSLVDVKDAGPDDSLIVNRALISFGQQRMLVYYWFNQRGRIVTNEYLAKWYIFRDSLMMNRTDGALVRVMTPVTDVSEIASADQRLQDFIRVAAPRLDYFIPGT